jgi:hypothetical protein
MSVDLLYQPEAVIPPIAAMLATITVGTSPGTPLQVDVDAVQGQLLPPRLILERGAGQSWWRMPMDRDRTVTVPFDVVAIGVSIDQAAALRGRVVQVVTGEGDGGWITPLTVTGLNVLSRELAGSLPRPMQAGGLAQALAYSAFATLWGPVKGFELCDATGDFVDDPADALDYRQEQLAAERLAAAPKVAQKTRAAASAKES